VKFFFQDAAANERRKQSMQHIWKMRGLKQLKRDRASKRQKVEEEG
jgi:hypothetical protein